MVLCSESSRSQARLKNVLNSENLENEKYSFGQILREVKESASLDDSGQKNTKPNIYLEILF